MEVRLKKLHKDAQLPVKKHEGDFCYDVYAVTEEEIAPNIWRYGLGFAYEIDRGDFPYVVFTNEKGEDCKTIGTDYIISIDYRPRSSCHETGMILSNCEGTLDEIYRGEAKAVYYHLFPDRPRYKIGDRIGQIKLGITIPLEFKWVDEIDENTERGKDGFGSTNEKKIKI